MPSTRNLEVLPAAYEQTLSAEELEKMDAYWRACNYLCAGMIYLRDNPLLKEPLRPEHFKNRLLVARAAAEGQRLSILNDQFTLRERHGTASTRQLTSAEELLEVLLKQFGLSFPEGTRFGGPAQPWPT